MKPFWSGALLALSLCADLGMVNLAVLEVSLQQGGTAGFILGIGSCIGDLVYFVAALFGATVLLEWIAVRWSLWVFGTAVLLWMAVKAARSVIRPNELSPQPASVSRGAGARLLMTGMGLALASPTAILWFVAVGGSVIASFGRQRSVLGEFVAGFNVASLVWGAAFAYSAAMLRRLGTGIVRALSLASAVLFLYFAGVVFLNGLRTLF